MNDDIIIIIITQIFNVHKMSLRRLNTNYKTLKMNLRHGYNILFLQYKEFEFHQEYEYMLTLIYNIKNLSS